MSALLDSPPLLVAAGSMVAAVSGVLGAWIKGQFVTRASVAASASRATVATEETERAALAMVPALLGRIAALEAHVARLDDALGLTRTEKLTLAQQLAAADARAVAAECECDAATARAELAELDAHDARAELAKWRDAGGASD